MAACPRSDWTGHSGGQARHRYRQSVDYSCTQVGTHATGLTIWSRARILIPLNRTDKPVADDGGKNPAGEMKNEADVFRGGYDRYFNHERTWNLSRRWPSGASLRKKYRRRATLKISRFRRDLEILRWTDWKSVVESFWTCTCQATRMVEIPFNENTLFLGTCIILINIIRI